MKTACTQQEATIISTIIVKHYKNITRGVSAWLVNRDVRVMGHEWPHERRDNTHGCNVLLDDKPRPSPPFPADLTIICTGEGLVTADSSPR